MAIILAVYGKIPNAGNELKRRKYEEIKTVLILYRVRFRFRDYEARIV